MQPWDRIAARVVQVGSRTQIGGGVLAFGHQISEMLLESFRKFDSLGSEEKREFAETNGYDLDAFADLSPTEKLRVAQDDGEPDGEISRSGQPDGHLQLRLAMDGIGRQRTEAMNETAKWLPRQMQMARDLALPRGIEPLFRP